MIFYKVNRKLSSETDSVHNPPILMSNDLTFCLFLEQCICKWTILLFLVHLVRKDYISFFMISLMDFVQELDVPNLIYMVKLMII